MLIDLDCYMLLCLQRFKIIIHDRYRHKSSYRMFLVLFEAIQVVVAKAISKATNGRLSFHERSIFEALPALPWQDHAP